MEIQTRYIVNRKITQHQSESTQSLAKDLVKLLNSDRLFKHLFSVKTNNFSKLEKQNFLRIKARSRKLHSCLKWIKLRIEAGSFVI